MENLDSSVGVMPTPSDSIDDWLIVDHQVPADQPKKRPEWFDITADEDIIADHYSETDSSGDEHPTSPIEPDSDHEDDFDSALLDPPAMANAPIPLPVSLSGVFYNTAAGYPAYAVFPQEPVLFDTSLSFLPETVTVMASTAGLVCCRGRHSRLYYICNPFTAEWTVIPASMYEHTDNASIVLIVDDGHYHIVCAYPISEWSGAFHQQNCYIETFDSRGWKWTASAWMVEAEIVRGSGVAAGAAAYWRTMEGMMVVYVPVVDEVLLSVPSGLCWELGELEGKLCCTSIRGTEAMVSVPMMLGEGIMGWEEEVNFDVGPDRRIVREQDLPLPVRSQGGNELLFWEGLMSRAGRYLVARDMATGRSRRLADNPLQPGDDLVPYKVSEIRVKKQPEKLLLNGNNEMQAARRDDTTKEEPEAEAGDKVSELIGQRQKQETKYPS